MMQLQGACALHVHQSKLLWRWKLPELGRSTTNKYA